ncbi:MAG: SMI1/KNR4 family protein [Sphingomonas sp.]|uniref:SMI1/KNR4 family protein n=1 Tax=Sphingomonas sp. TaxID=28214 RepID=UPI0025E5E124|nr:SMI1/KNR4 family protein [Sphingomonas sp.]MBX3563721.1 SMI1/KNR4 family protein [Sphingomonas sp.]
MGWIADWLARRAADRRQRHDLRLAVQAAAARRACALAEPGASPVQRLLLWWGREPSAAALDTQLHALEQRYAITLPDDFRRYLQAAMPEGNAWDDEGTRWFPLADIKSLREECADWETASALDSDKLLVFADHLMWCYAWAVDCSDTENRGKVAVITSEDHYIAASFDDFLDLYIRNNRAIH